MSEYIVEVNDHPTIKQEGWNVRCDDLFIQREEIVRCRDCKRYVEDEMEYWHYCNNWCGQVKPDGFCAWGERRSDDR